MRPGGSARLWVRAQLDVLPLASIEWCMCFEIMRLDAAQRRSARVVGNWEVCLFWKSEEQLRILPLHCAQGQDDSALGTQIVINVETPGLSSAMGKYGFAALRRPYGAAG